MRRAIPLTALVALAFAGAAEARPFYGKAWREAPAYTTTVPAYGGVRVIPPNVCPFGVSDIAASRGQRELPAPRVDTLSFMDDGVIVNGYHKTLRAWVWCG